MNESGEQTKGFHIIKREIDVGASQVRNVVVSREIKQATNHCEGVEDLD